MAKRYKRQNRSHFHKIWTNECTPQQGYVYPIMIKEALPGDTWKLSVSQLTRTAALLAPFYGQIDVRIACFKDLKRNLWDKFDDFRTGGKNNQDTSEVPYILANASNCDFGSLLEYLGVPALAFKTLDSDGVYQDNSQVLKIDAMPVRLINKIYNEWLLKEHVQEELAWSDQSGYDTTTNTDLFRIGWGHDRFMDALPDQQLGPQASLPLALSAPVLGTGAALGITDGTTSGSWLGQSAQSAHPKMASGHYIDVGDTGTDVTNPGNNKGIGVVASGDNSGLVADLSQAASVTIPQLQLAIKMQEVATRLMLFGSRMTEWLADFWGVKGDDARLQRSQYIGGYSTSILVSPVEQTSSTDATSPQGNLAGRGVSASRGRYFTTHFKEDGYIVVLAWIRPRTKYAQGLPRMFTRFTRMDYALPVFQHLPMQPIYNYELKAVGVENGTSATDWDASNLPDNGVFGYEMIYDDYRRFYSEVHGEFLNTLSYWTTWLKMENTPQLNSQFVECDPSEDMFAVPNGTNFMSQFVFDCHVWRKLAKRGTPRFGV